MSTWSNGAGRTGTFRFAYGGGEPRLSRETRDVMDAADNERSQFGDEYLSTEHILLALPELVGVSREELLRRV